MDYSSFKVEFLRKTIQSFMPLYLRYFRYCRVTSGIFVENKTVGSLRKHDVDGSENVT